MKSNNILAWGSAQLFFMLSVLVAVVFAILSSEIERQLGLDASDLGLLGGVFFVTYAVSQLALGILISRIPARWVLGPTAILTALGTFYFSLSEGLTAAIIARALMGLGLGKYLCRRHLPRGTALWRQLRLHVRPEPEPG